MLAPNSHWRSHLPHDCDFGVFLSLCQPARYHPQPHQLQCPSTWTFRKVSLRNIEGELNFEYVLIAIWLNQITKNIEHDMFDSNLEINYVLLAYEPVEQIMFIYCMPIFSLVGGFKHDFYFPSWSLPPNTKRPPNTKNRHPSPISENFSLANLTFNWSPLKNNLKINLQFVGSPP